MKQDQKHSPKYWVVHDKNYSDVYIGTASKSKICAIDNFIDNNSFDYWGTRDYDKLVELFYNTKDLEVILVEINIVKV